MDYNGKKPKQVVQGLSETSRKKISENIVDCFFVITSNGKLVIQCKWSEHYGVNIITPLSHKGRKDEDIDDLFKRTTKEYFGNRDLSYIREDGKKLECDGKTFFIYVIKGIDTINAKNISLIDIKKLKQMAEDDPNKITVSGKSEQYSILPSFMKALKVVLP